MGIDASARASVLGIETNFLNLKVGKLFSLPQRIAIMAHGSSAVTYPTTKQQITSASQAATIYGSGSPIHLCALELLPPNGDGVGTIPVEVLPLVDNVSGVAATGDILPAGTQTITASYTVNVNEIISPPFLITAGDSVATIIAAIIGAINGEPNMPIIASDGTTTVDVVAKWEGLAGNDIDILVQGAVDGGTTFAVTNPVGGLNSGVITAALGLIGDTWTTMLLNTNVITFGADLDEIKTFGDGRWAAPVHKPLVSFVGQTESVFATAIAVPDARPTDRINSVLNAPGSRNLPFVVAARQLAVIASVANNNAPVDYVRRQVTRLTPGADSVQWSQTQLDVAIKAGTSGTKVIDGLIHLNDTVTFYHPASEPNPAFQYVVDIVKLMTIQFNLNLIFESNGWPGAPIVADTDLISNPQAKRPKAAVAAIATLLDELGQAAIIIDPEAAKKTTTAVFDPGNPKRLNVATTVQLSGNANIIDVTLNFGFFFGTPTIIA